jgi:hypothetical protein
MDFSFSGPQPAPSGWIGSTHGKHPRPPEATGGAGVGCRLESAGDHRRLRERATARRGRRRRVEQARRVRPPACRRRRRPGRPRRGASRRGARRLRRPPRRRGRRVRPRPRGARRLDAHPHDELPRLVPRPGRQPASRTPRRAPGHRRHRAGLAGSARRHTHPHRGDGAPRSRRRRRRRTGARHRTVPIDVEAGFDAFATRSTPPSTDCSSTPLTELCTAPDRTEVSA